MQKSIYTFNLLFFTLLLFTSCQWTVSAKEPGNQNAAFEWRSIYSPTSADEAKEDPKNSQHVDYSWGLWGHNLKKAFEEYKGTDAYALVDGNRDKSQFCFSSPDTYKCIESYILNQFGDGSGSYHERICIIPNDNHTVCQCNRCKKMGCTETSATPAVAAVLMKLAKRFPKHQFFTAGYSTTAEAPKKKMPQNVGVILSTMDIPMRYVFNESNGFKKFDEHLKQWRKVVDKLYVWEYDRNFDDYLSPYPCLSILQKRFQYYRDNGVSGVFINGSGYDYSSFDDIQTEVIEQLLVDPDQDVDKLMQNAIDQLYPQTHESISDFYMTMEKTVRDKNINLPYYGTVDDELGYIDASDFNKKWIALDKESKSVEGKERRRLSQLLTALSFTRMELTRITGDKSQFNDILEVLSEFFETPNMTNYRETGGSLDFYVEDCRKLHRAPEINERR